MSDNDETVFDDDNPEWTEADFARARPIEEFPELLAAFPNTRVRSRAAGKQLVSLRIDRDIIERFKAGGAGWQTRINEALRKAIA